MQVSAENLNKKLSIRPSLRHLLALSLVGQQDCISNRYNRAVSRCQMAPKESFSGSDAAGSKGSPLLKRT